MALIGGVGGTLTILCYGYWIREKEREGVGELRLCRVDLGVGYAATALFCMAMVVIGSTIEVEGRGAALVVDLADRLEGPLGPVGRWIFLIGFVLVILSLIIISISYGLERLDRFEVAAISIYWLVLIINGVLLSVLFREQAKSVKGSG